MIKDWFIAARPWSFTAAFVPVALGTSLAWHNGFFSPQLFFLTSLGAIAVQAGTNFINTYGDYCAGVDSVESAHTCPQLVTGAMRPAAMKTAGLLSFAFAAAIGLLLSYWRGWEIIAIGLAGIIGGYTYTSGPLPYKYKGLGSMAVFFLMGPMITWPAWFIQTGQYSWLPVWASLPVGFLVTAILNGNDARDIQHDRSAGIITPATLFGLNWSLRLQRLLYLGAFVSLFLLVFVRLLPLAALLPLLLLPFAIKAFSVITRADKGGVNELLQLEAMAAGFHFQFGILLAAGIALNRWLATKGF